MKQVEMKKYLCGSNGWSENGTVVFNRVSRWIKVRQNYNATKKNALWYYVTDENGNGSSSDSFNPENGTFLDYFRFNGRTYALNQFLVLGNPFYNPVSYSYEDKEGKNFFLSGYDSENYFNPLFIELDEYGEYVRIYEEA